MKTLTKKEKEKLRRDTKSYYVSAVLDKATSDRILRPLPARSEVQSKDGSTLILTLEMGVAGGKVRR